MATAAAPPAHGPVTDTYARLEEKVLDREQLAASAIFYDLVRAGRPLPELLRELVRIHAPYTHVPYHQRLDDGIPRFVNNDHCFLSSRASMDLMRLVDPDLAWLPLAQTIWYMPTGLDPWNQLIGKMPGHYVRLYELHFEGKPPRPEVHWPDQKPLAIEGTFKEKLNAWLTLVQRGEVITAYRVFLGLWDEVATDEVRRRELMAHLVFAGLIDVQDRMLYNRSYTTGHKSYRARATAALARAVGWQDVHPILYAGVPDMAVGPRWYSTYEMACLVVQNFLDGRDAELLANDGPLTAVEAQALHEALLTGEEPGYLHLIVGLLKAGRGIRQIIDTIQLASAQVILDTGNPNNFSMAQHSFEYCNTVRWFFDTFEHPHRLKLLFVAGAFVNRASHHQRSTPENGPTKIEPPRAASGMGQGQLLDRLDDSLMRLAADEAVDWTAAYLATGFDRGPLVRTLATGAAKTGNDPHNQELGIGLLEDYEHSTSPDRERLLLACAKHTAGHRKYGDCLEAYRRFAEAFGISAK